MRVMHLRANARLYEEAMPNDASVDADNVPVLSIPTD